MENFAETIYAGSQVLLYVLLCMLVGMFIVQGLKNKKPKSKIFYGIFTCMSGSIIQSRMRVVPSDVSALDMKAWIIDQQQAIAIENNIEPGDVVFKEIQIIKV